MLVCLLGAFATLGPAAALASGPSAGDQQYVDPLGGSHHHNGGGSGGSGSSNPTTSTPSSTTPTGTTASGTGTTAATGTTTGTGTTANTSATTTSSKKTLPFTGLNVGLAVAIGMLMLAGGAGMRRSLRRRA